jgi:hypothetical protein
MLCPTCQTVALTTLERCPSCGQELRRVVPEGALTSVAAVVPPCPGDNHSTATVPSAAAESPIVGTFAGLRERPELALIVAEPVARRLPLLARVPELPALAWRQPVVRAVVKTGAGALVLSLAVRAARQALAGRGRAGVSPPHDALPRLLAELLPPEEPARRHTSVRRAPAAEVTEVLLYARRVARR